VENNLFQIGIKIYLIFLEILIFDIH